MEGDKKERRDEMGCVRERERERECRRRNMTAEETRVHNILQWTRKFISTNFKA